MWISECLRQEMTRNSKSRELEGKEWNLRGSFKLTGKENSKLELIILLRVVFIAK